MGRIRHIETNELLVTREGKSLLFFDEEPTSPDHHNRLVREAIERKDEFEPGAMVVAVAVSKIYGTNIKVIEPATGRQGWMVYTSFDHGTDNIN